MYHDPELCTGDELLNADPSNPLYHKVVDLTTSLLHKLIKIITDKLNAWIGGMGSKAFEDIYTPHFCGMHIFSQPIMIAVAFAIGFFVLLYMIGVIIKNQKFINMAKSEFWEMLILLPLIGVLLQIPCLEAPFSKVTLYQGAMLYLHSAVTSTILSLVPFTVGYGVIVSSQVSLSQSWLGMGPPDTKPPSVLYTDYSWNMLFSNAAMFLTLGYLSIASFLYMFDLLTYGMIKFILPFALLLRFIPPTKRIGGGLIGVAIGLAIFMPLIFWINYEFIKVYGFAYYEVSGSTVELKLNPILDTLIEYAAILAGAALLYMGVMYMLASTKLGKFLSSAAGKLGGKAASVLKGKLLKWVSQGSAANALATILRLLIPLYSMNSRLLLVAVVYVPVLFLSFSVVTFSILLNLILPAITFIVVATGVRAMSGLFGQEIDISNLTRLV